MTDTKALQLYPKQQEIDTLAHRVRDLLPGADKFNDAVLTAFAQISLAHDLDPFIGEVWIIPTKRGPRIRAGIEGHRKAAHKQSTYQLRQRQMTGAERDAHGLRDTQVAAVTEIFRTDSRIEGQAFNPTCGYGIWTPGDQIAKTKTPLWVAFKRSEQDALRKAFDLPFAGEANGASQPLPAHSQARVASTGANGSQPALPRPEAAGSARQAAAELYGDWDGNHLGVGENDPPAEAQEDIIDTTATVISDKPQANGSDPPLDQFGSFTSPEAAITWAIRQGAFLGIDHARRAYAALRKNARPKNAQQMAKFWIADVTYRLEEAPI